jgi:type VI protein secretion system component Hcp
MRKLRPSLIAAIAIVFAAPSALAGGARSSPSLHTYTATGKHIDKGTITARTNPKPKGGASHSDLTVSKTSDKASP